MGVILCKKTIQTKLSWVEGYKGVEPFTFPPSEGEIDDAKVPQRRKFVTQMGGNLIKNLLTMSTQYLFGNKEEEEEKSPMKMLTDMSISLHKNLVDAHKEGRYSPDIIVNISQNM